ncbi:major facilitator superfamily domain-containing protein [Lipomyces tetrasporus]
MKDDIEESLNPETSLLGDTNEHYGYESDFDHKAEIEKLMSEGRRVLRDPEEEEVIRRKLDYRLMGLVRNNIQNTDFLIDANVPQNTYNLGQTIFLLFFILCEIPLQTLVRRFGAEIWLPILMTLWAIISMFHICIRESLFFLFTRAIIGACGGGFVPGLTVISALLASGFIRIGGSLRGWQWLFLLEGALTAVIGILSFFMMPSLRHKVVPRVVRVVQDDPSKHNQQERVKLGSGSLLKSLTAVIGTLTDRCLFPIFILGFVAFYLTITPRQLNFTETVTNLLMIPYAIINLSDKFGVRWIFCLVSAIWLFTYHSGRPFYHPILFSWILSNANNPDRRSLAFAVYSISVQCGNILAANVYRESDTPYYHRGNGILIGLNVLSMAIILAIRQYYVVENRRRDKL